MTWKGLGVLGTAAALIVVGVVGLARLTIPDEPTFSEGLEEASPDESGELEFVPTAIGAELEVTGAREATITLDSTASGPTYGLGDSTTRIFFETDPLSISQMSHDGLAFFPEPGDCELTVGEHNEEVGLAAVQVSCAELVDIRDNGTISLQGHVAVPADLVLDLDLPETGGTVTVGDEEWELSPDAVLFLAPQHAGGDSDTGPGLFVQSDDGLASLIFGFSYDPQSETLALQSVSYKGGRAQVEPGECSTEVEEVATVNPQSSIHEMSFSCESLQISSLGDVPVDGMVVFQRLVAEDH